MILFAATEIALDTYFRMANLRAADVTAGSTPRVTDNEFNRQHARTVAHLKANGASKIDLKPGVVTFSTPRNHKLQTINNTVGV